MKTDNFKVADKAGKPYADGTFREVTLKELVELIEMDYEKFSEKQNKTAGVRCRKRLQELKTIIKALRDNIQEVKKTIE